MRTYLDNHSCDRLALLDTWHIDNNIDCFCTIHDNYMNTAISRVDESLKNWHGALMDEELFYMRKVCVTTLI